VLLLYTEKPLAFQHQFRGDLSGGLSVLCCCFILKSLWLSSINSEEIFQTGFAPSESCSSLKKRPAHDAPAWGRDDAVTKRVAM